MTSIVTIATSLLITCLIVRYSKDTESDDTTVNKYCNILTNFFSSTGPSPRTTMDAVTLTGGPNRK